MKGEGPKITPVAAPERQVVPRIKEVEYSDAGTPRGTDAEVMEYGEDEVAAVKPDRRSAQEIDAQIQLDAAIARGANYEEVFELRQELDFARKASSQGQRERRTGTAEVIWEKDADELAMEEAREREAEQLGYDSPEEREAMINYLHAVERKASKDELLDLLDDIKMAQLATVSAQKRAQRSKAELGDREQMRNDRMLGDFTAKLRKNEGALRGIQEVAPQPLLEDEVTPFDHVVAPKRKPAGYPDLPIDAERLPVAPRADYKAMRTQVEEAAFKKGEEAAFKEMLAQNESQLQPMRDLKPKEYVPKASDTMPFGVEVQSDDEKVATEVRATSQLAPSRSETVEEYKERVHKQGMDEVDFERVVAKALRLNPMDVALPSERFLEKGDFSDPVGMSQYFQDMIDLGVLRDALMERGKVMEARNLEAIRQKYIDRLKQERDFDLSELGEATERGVVKAGRSKKAEEAVKAYFDNRAKRGILPKEEVVWVPDGDEPPVPQEEPEKLTFKELAVDESILQMGRLVDEIGNEADLETGMLLTKKEVEAKKKELAQTRMAFQKMALKMSPKEQEELMTENGKRLTVDELIASMRNREAEKNEQEFGRKASAAQNQELKQLAKMRQDSRVMGDKNVLATIMALEQRLAGSSDPKEILEIVDESKVIREALG